MNTFSRVIPPVLSQRDVARLCGSLSFVSGCLAVLCDVACLLVYLYGLPVAHRKGVYLNANHSMVRY